MHVPNGYLKEVFNSLLTSKQIVRFPMDPNTVYVLESRPISMDDATQTPVSEFEASRWHNSRVCAVNNCSCSHINFGQTGGDLPF